MMPVIVWEEEAIIERVNDYRSVACSLRNGSFAVAYQSNINSYHNRCVNRTKGDKGRK